MLSYYNYYLYAVYNSHLYSNEYVKFTYLFTCNSSIAIYYLLKCHSAHEGRTLSRRIIVIPRVVDYLNYREYLRDFYLAKKNDKKEYSYRVFLSRGGIKSPSHLKMVIDGQRNLTSKTVAKYIIALNLIEKNEQKYFYYLVQYNQSDDIDKKGNLFQLLMEEKRKKGLTLIEQAQYNFLANWYNVVIYVLIDMKSLKENDPSLIKTLRSKVTTKMIEEAFATLKILGFIEKVEDGYYKQTNGALSTSDDIKNIAIHKYHHSMINLGIESLEKDDLQKREFNGVTLPINREKLPLLKEKIREFRKDVNSLTSAFADPTQVYQLNIQLFPLTEEIK